jgi:hypothetical protein
MTDADDRLSMEAFLHTLCPISAERMPAEEKGQLVATLVQMRRRAAQNEAKTLQLHQRNYKLVQENVNIRRTLMLVGSYIPEDDGPAKLPKELSAGLRSIFEKAAAQLAGKGGTPLNAQEQAVYQNPVRCVHATERAIQVLDLLTQRVFWVPRSQILDSSEVLDVTDEGTLVATKFIAEQRRRNGDEFWHT